MSRPDGRVLGVGILGAGPVTQAIHLPTLATLADRLDVVSVMDVDRHVGEAVARRAGARFTDSTAELLDDPAVDVVAVCSPPQFHADQIVAACEAGKLGVLCEKPLAATAQDRRRIVEVAERTGVPIVVGAMHAYDPAYVAAAHAAETLRRSAHTVRSTIYLPGNDVMIEQATDPVPAGPADPAATGAEPDRHPQPDEQWARTTVRNGVFGLASHHLPLVRAFAGDITSVRFARAVRPWGYDLVLQGSRCTVHLTAVMGGQWAADWRFEAWSDDASLSVAFPPSYVLAGSSHARLSDASGTRTWHENANGYQQEWSDLADIVTGRTAARVSLREIVDDFELVLWLADAAADATRPGQGPS